LPRLRAALQMSAILYFMIRTQAVAEIPLRFCSFHVYTHVS
jgi:hypothetical protein